MTVSNVSTDFVRQHYKEFSLAKIEDMVPEDIELHLILGGMQTGRLRERVVHEEADEGDFFV